MANGPDYNVAYEGDNPMLEQLLAAGAKHWETDESSLMQNMLRTSLQETGGTLDPTTIQGSGSPGEPGRGMYQYEMNRPGQYDEKGNEYINQGAHTAVNRLIGLNNANDMGIKLWDKNEGQPDWIGDLIKSNYDFSTLTGEQQSILFLADKMKDPTASFKNVTSLQDMGEEWAAEHQAGTEAGTPERTAMEQKYIKNVPLFEKNMPLESEALPFSKRLVVPERESMMSGLLEQYKPDLSAVPASTLVNLNK